GCHCALPPWTWRSCAVGRSGRWAHWTSNSFPSGSTVVMQHSPSAARYSGPKDFGPSAWTAGPAAGAWAVPGLWTGAVTDHIVVGDRVLLDVSFRAARARLEILARGEMLLWASEVAYGEGITRLVKLAGPAAGLTRLAGVRLDDLAQTFNCAH